MRQTRKAGVKKRGENRGIPHDSRDFAARRAASRFARKRAERTADAMSVAWITFFTKGTFRKRLRYLQPMACNRQSSDGFRHLYLDGNEPQLFGVFEVHRNAVQTHLK